MRQLTLDAFARSLLAVHLGQTSERQLTLDAFARSPPVHFGQTSELRITVVPRSLLNMPPVNFSQSKGLVRITVKPLAH